MACPFSDDLRPRGLSAARDGMAVRSAAARVGIGASTAIGWIANERQGQMTPANQGRPSGCRLDTAADCIATMIAAPTEIRGNDTVFRLRQETAIAIGRSALAVWRRTRGWALKKDRTCTGARARGSVKAARDGCARHGNRAADRRVFRDQTG